MEMLVEKMQKKKEIFTIVHLLLCLRLSLNQSNINILLVCSAAFYLSKKI